MIMASALYLVPIHKWPFGAPSALGDAILILEIARYSCGSNLAPALNAPQIPHLWMDTI
jgi:hypothetical protein